jgi:hypothetical protein
MVWKINRKHTQAYIALPELVVADNRKVSDTHTTAAASSGGANLLTTARAGSVSLCFKNHKAQTVGLQAPGCEDELSGLDPANRAAFSFMKAIPMISAIGRRIGLCQLAVKHGIKTPTGRGSYLDLQSTNYVKKPRRTASHARSSRKLAVDIVISMGGINENNMEV